MVATATDAVGEHRDRDHVLLLRLDAADRLDHRSDRGRERARRRGRGDLELGRHRAGHRGLGDLPAFADRGEHLDDDRCGRHDEPVRRQRGTRPPVRPTASTTCGSRPSTATATASRRRPSRCGSTTRSPTGSITAPTAGANVRGTTVAVSSNSADTSGSGVANATFQRSPIGAGTWTQIGSPDTSSPYSVNWDTTGVTDGQYDLPGHHDRQRRQHVHLGHRHRSGRQHRTDDRCGDADGHGRDQRLVHQRRDGHVAGTDRLRLGHREHHLQHARGGQHEHERQRSGRDLLGDRQRRQRHAPRRRSTIKRDEIDPTGSLTAPADGAVVTGSVTVSSDSADANSGVANATFQYSPAGANTWTTIGAPDTTQPVQRELEHRCRCRGRLRPAGRHDRQRRPDLHLGDPDRRRRHAPRRP